MTSADSKTLFKNVLSKSRHIIVVAGAGLSAASGLPTFRGRGGLWRKYQATSLATPQAFEENPSRVWQFYHYRREAALRAAPNAAHYALARFASPQIRESRCAPNSTLTLITQNVDGLSPTALREVSSSVTIPKETDERPHVIEMHGRLHDIICTKCDYGAYDRSSPICQALAGTEELLESADVEVDIALEDLPRCGVCGALARPGVVWFGERPHHLDLIDSLVREADLCLVVGTSSTVYPAARYALMVQRYGGKVAVFNLERTKGDEHADFLFLGPCEKTLPEALGLE